MSTAADSLAGKRVLIVEDDTLVGFLIEEYLADARCDTVGPFGTVAKALNAVRTETFDLAVLDINLNGERSYPVAEALAERGIPFLFLSGYGDGVIPSGHQDWKVCKKPFVGDDLIGMLAATLALETM
jgi:DNA-binding NtrC family response regulator